MDGEHDAESAQRPGPGEQPAGDNSTEISPRTRRRLGLALAPLLALVVYWILPAAALNGTGEIISGLSQPGRAVAAVGVLMVALWVTVALPIAATALMPIALFPLLTGGAFTVKQVTAPTRTR